MRINDIVVESDLDEAPANFIKQGLRRLGAKAAGAIGMKGTAASLTNKADTGKEANQVKVDLQGYLGGMGGDLNKLDAAQLSAFLKSKKLPTDAVPASGIVPPKAIDDIILKAVQQSKTLGGGSGGSTAGGSAATSGGDAGASTGGGAATTQGAAQQGTGAQGTATSAAGGGTPGVGGTGQGGKESEIPPNIQAMLDELTPTEKKALAGLI